MEVQTFPGGCLQQQYDLVSQRSCGEVRLKHREDNMTLSCRDHVLKYGWNTEKTIWPHLAEIIWWSTAETQKTTWPHLAEIMWWGMAETQKTIWPCLAEIMWWSTAETQKTIWLHLAEIMWWSTAETQKSIWPHLAEIIWWSTAETQKTIWPHLAEIMWGSTAETQETIWPHLAEIIWYGIAETKRRQYDFVWQRSYGEVQLKQREENTLSGRVHVVRNYWNTEKAIWPQLSKAIWGRIIYDLLSEWYCNVT